MKLEIRHGLYGFKQKNNKFLNTLILEEGSFKLYMNSIKYFDAKLKYITIFTINLKKNLYKCLTVK